MKPGTIKKIKTPLTMMLFALLAQVAYGQTTVGVPTLSTILASTEPGDKSVGIFYHLLGDFFINPLSSIASTPTLIGALFLIFNSAVFVIGMVWAGYGLLGGIAETAHTGEALGKRLSAVWLPIRMVTGIAGIIPVFGGFSLSQVFIVSMTAVGIGLANGMFHGAVGKVNEFVSLSPPVVAASSGGTGIDFEAAVKDMFVTEVCAASKKSMEKNAQNLGIPVIDPIKQTLTISATKASVHWGTFTSIQMCGRSTITKAKEQVRSDSSTFGFRVASVNYGAPQYKDFSDKVAAAYIDSFSGAHAAVAVLANKWHTDRALANKTAKASPAPFPTAQLKQVADNWTASVQAKVDVIAKGAKNSTGALSTGAMRKMKEDGWLGLGGWFATFQEANAALSDAMKAVEYSSDTPALWLDPAVSNDLTALDKARDASVAGSGDSLWSDAQEWLCKQTVGSCRNATGEVSIGQAMIKGAIDAAAVGTGGGNLINPIIMFKNLGDTSMVLGQTIMAAGYVADQIDVPGVSAKDDDKTTLSGKAARAAASAAAKGPGLLVKFFLKAGAGVVAFAKLIAPFLLVLGMLMAVYIPMIPFITWMGGVVQYAVVVCQGLVGAPIAALSHLEAEGEGLGRRTEAGYMFILNVTFRPALMLFGFFLASALMIVVGTFQAGLFVDAMANAQGNSITGFFSFVAFLTIFAVINITLIQGLMNMIFLLPDQVLGLIGTGGAMTDIGKETEGKLHGMFLAYGRTMQGIAGAPGGGKRPAHMEPGGGGTGAGGTGGKPSVGAPPPSFQNR